MLPVCLLMIAHGSFLSSSVTRMCIKTNKISITLIFIAACNCCQDDKEQTESGQVTLCCWSAQMQEMSARRKENARGETRESCATSLNRRDERGIEMTFSTPFPQLTCDTVGRFPLCLPTVYNFPSSHDNASKSRHVAILDGSLGSSYARDHHYSDRAFWMLCKGLDNTYALAG